MTETVTETTTETTTQATRAAQRREPVFTGVAVALATLFTDALEVDYDATAQHARRLAEAGVRAIVVCGTTGEPETLAEEEMLGILDAVLAAVPRATPVVMGASLPTAYQSVRFVRRIGARPVAGIIARSPRDILDPVAYYAQLAAAVGATPLLAYHFPQVAPPGIPVAAVADLPVAGIKDSSGDADRLFATLGRFGGAIYVGSPALLLLAGRVGAAGAILQIANALPELSIAAYDGDADAQRELADAQVRAPEPFPLGIKRLMAQRFGTSLATRLG